MWTIGSASQTLRLGTQRIIGLRAAWIVRSRSRSRSRRSNSAKPGQLQLYLRRIIIIRAMSSDLSESRGAQAAEEEEDVIVQYVVLRRDLIETWPMGSLVTQGCHASVAAVWENKDDIHTLAYCSPSNLDFMHKVTLQVKGETQLMNLSDKLKEGGIVHKLWIEQPENYPTCLATKPYPKSFLSPFFKKLKLCK